jgi:RNA polymerase sigma factor (sigma-70 family)
MGSGDANAATAFVRRFQARVYGLAHTLLGDSALADDVAQEAFLRAWRHADAYDRRRGRVATWLLAITRNLAIDRLRVRRAEPLDPEAVTRAIDRIGADANPAERLPGPVSEAVAELPAEQRRALLMAALFGFTAREIGELEGAPLGTLKTRIRTGLLRVRRDLEGVADEL